MLFDDCNWGDHCAAVANGCRDEMTGLGPVVVRTPRELRVAEWEKGLELYQERVAKFAPAEHPSNSTSKRPTYLSRTHALSPTRARGIRC